MCLAVTGKIVSVTENVGKVMIGEQLREVSLIAVPDVQPGDHVLVSLGMAMERISEQEAEEIDATWDEIASLSIEGPEDKA